MAKKTYAQMLAAQRAANSPERLAAQAAPIETSGEHATNTAYEEPATMQRAIGSVAAVPDNTRIADAPIDEQFLNTPAVDEPETKDNPDEESEESVVTRAFKALGDRLREAAPHIDFKAEYAKLMEENKKPERRKLSPLHALALSLGGGNEAVDRAQKNVDTENDENESRFRELLGYKEQALKGQIEQMLNEGKFKQALVQSEELAKMNAVLDRIKTSRANKHEMDVERERNRGRVAVAHVKADAAKSMLQSRLTSLADTYNLKDKVRELFFRSMFDAFSKRAVMQDITGNPALSSDDFVNLLQQAEDWAEAHGEDLDKPLPRPSSLGGKTPAPAGATTPPANETDEQKVLRELRQSKR